MSRSQRMGGLSGRLQASLYCVAGVLDVAVLSYGEGTEEHVAMFVVTRERLSKREPSAISPLTSRNSPLARFTLWLRCLGVQWKDIQERALAKAVTWQ